MKKLMIADMERICPASTINIGPGNIILRPEFINSLLNNDDFIIGLKRKLFPNKAVTKKTYEDPIITVLTASDIDKTTQYDFKITNHEPLGFGETCDILKFCSKRNIGVGYDDYNYTQLDCNSTIRNLVEYIRYIEDCYIYQLENVNNG